MGGAGVWAGSGFESEDGDWGRAGLWPANRPCGLCLLSL